MLDEIHLIHTPPRIIETWENSFALDEAHSKHLRSSLSGRLDRRLFINLRLMPEPLDDNKRPALRQWDSEINAVWTSRARFSSIPLDQTARRLLIDWTSLNALRQPKEGGLCLRSID